MENNSLNETQRKALENLCVPCPYPVLTFLNTLGFLFPNVVNLEEISYD